jgi:integrase
MKQLSGGCRVSRLSVTPSNWKSAKATTSGPWRISYRFYDPRFPNPKQVVIRGMNKFHELKDRRAATMALIEQETTILDAGFNPFDNVLPEMATPVIGQKMALGDALEFAVGKIRAVKGTLIDIRSVIRGTIAAARALQLADLAIGEVSRRHIKQILEYLRETNPRFSNHRFNKYRAYLSRVFRELIEMELIDTNPVRDIAKAKETFSMRETLTADELARLAELKTMAPAFYRYVAIFFYSGSRTTELFRLKFEDVDLSKQEFRVLVKKGNSYREDIRVVTDDALPLWTELMATGKPGMYVFSRGLKPGRDQIRPDQINRRWNKYVIQGLGIKKDFYSLKHTFADMIAAKLDINHAATLDGHTTPVITLKHYAPGERARERERIKKSGIRLG